MRVAMMNGRVAMTNGRTGRTLKTILSPVMTGEMVGKGKKQITNLMLKLETPKKYISFE